MNNEVIFLYAVSIAAICFGLVNVAQFLLKRNKTAQTVGTIISVKTLNPETAKTRNSKWATVSYKVNDKIYQSQNRIQVPMTSQIGSTVRVRYDKSTPEKLYSFSIIRLIMSFIVAAICFLMAVFKFV